MQTKQCFSLLKKWKKSFEIFHKELLKYGKSVPQFYVVLTKYQYKISQYNTLNVKFSNLQLNKLKSGIKSNNEVTLKIPSNICGDSNNGNNFPHNLLLTDIQVSKLLANNSSANIILSKTQLHKIVQPGKILGSIL